ncbi:MAG: single-stranded DNA-binding protein [Candidatus Omnitrophota bacterium]
MSIEINSVIIGGNLTRDVQLKELSSGSKVAVFTVATNRTYISQGQKNQETAFIDVDVWGRMAETCAQYLSKGRAVVVTGRLKQDQWENEQGQKRSRLKVVAQNVQFMPTGGSRENRVAEEESSYGSVSWED